MNKKLFTTLAVIFFSATLFAQNDIPVTFTISPEFGLLYGQITENVWYVNQKKTSTQTTYTPTTRMSRLDWEMENAPYFGAAMNLTFKRRFSFDFSFSSALSRENGAMEDFDWLNPVNPKWQNDPLDELTNYSVHKMLISDYTKVAFAFGYNFYPDKKENIRLTPTLGVQAQSFDFTGIGGYYLYKINNFNTLSFPQNAKVINYRQSYLAPFTGVSAWAYLFNFLDTGIDINAIYSHRINAYDNHIQKNNTGEACYYKDELQDVFILDAQLSVLCRITKHNKIGIKGGITFSPDSYGFTYYSAKSFDDLNKTPASELGGSSRLIFNFAVVYSFVID